jgi:hypothetical protein
VVAGTTTCRSRASRAWPEHPKCRRRVDLRQLATRWRRATCSTACTPTSADLEFARQACERASGFTIGGADAQPHVFVEF